jgi:formylglycine-generating enzyme required for sulfatase activity
LVLVRDDFGMAATRFMRELEVPIVEGHNFATVDLFDAAHARKVLAAFGRAFGRLPDRPADAQPAQEQFLKHAVAGLAEEGKVICVRLALFAEMMKGRPWTPASLKEVGGARGIGVTFLEETLGARASHPSHRLYQRAARAVLQALLPDQGTDLKGNMRSRHDLIRVAGYEQRPAEFEDLLRILDTELRLVTPTDPEGPETDDCPPQAAAPEECYYQLTHDFLVPSLREWLTRKRKETRRGRAALRLAEQAALWKARPVNRHLPSWWEWAGIRLLTRPKDWTPSQRQMMTRAGRVYAVQAGILGLVFLAAGLMGTFLWQRHRAGELVKQLLTAEMDQVPKTIDELEGCRGWANPILRTEHQQAPSQSLEKVKMAMALLPVDPSQAEFLSGELLRMDDPRRFSILRDWLGRYGRDEVAAGLWKHLAVTEPAEIRFRAAAALAAYAPEDARWLKIQKDIALQFAKQEPLVLPGWADAFQPVAGELIEPLKQIFRDPGRGDSEHLEAAILLSGYLAADPNELTRLALDADEQQFPLLFLRLQKHREQAIILLRNKLDEHTTTEPAKEVLAKQKAVAAVALLKLEQTEPFWPLLKQEPDPRVRSYLIHRLAPYRADSRKLVDRLRTEKEVSSRRALLLALGEFSVDEAAPGARQTLLAELTRMCEDDPDPGVHAAAGWLLGRWGYSYVVEGIKRQLAAGRPQGSRRWYGTQKGGSTMMIVDPAPQGFDMGSPKDEISRGSDEARHRRCIGSAFALATTEITLEQFRRFQKDFKYTGVEKYIPSDNCAVNGVTWHQAAAYCNWLSQQEGIPEVDWCFLPKGNGKWQPAPGYRKHTGYRLPTEVEWEYACRAGTTTSRFYGETDELLGKYAWFADNSKGRLWPVASLKPNDFGLFDIYGNVSEWCMEPYRDYPAGKAMAEDQEISGGLDDDRVSRGGAFSLFANHARSAARNRDDPAIPLLFAGFRVARTVPSDWK